MTDTMDIDDALRVIRALEALGYFSPSDFEGIPEGEMAEEVVEHLKRHPSGIYPPEWPQ